MNYRTKKLKFIIINGIQRAGTNVVWNIVQSHPDVVSPILETGEVVFPACSGNGVLRHSKRLMRNVMRTGSKQLINFAFRRLQDAKSLTLNDENNRYLRSELPL